MAYKFFFQIPIYILLLFLLSFYFVYKNECDSETLDYCRMSVEQIDLKLNFSLNEEKKIPVCYKKNYVLSIYLFINI